MDVFKLVLTHFDFHLNALFITLCSKYDISIKNSEKTDFLILSSPFHIHSILKLAPVLSQKSEKMHLVRTFPQLYRKNEYGEPHFLFHKFIKDSTSFR